MEVKSPKSYYKTTVRYFKRMLLLLLLLASVRLQAQIVVNSLSELMPYLEDDNANIKLAPGVYSITANDIANGLYTSKTSIVGKEVKVLLLFEGNNSTYDFTDVTLNIETAVFKAFGNYQVFEIQITGNDNVLNNLTLVDVGSVYDSPTSGALNICMDGARNRIEGFDVTVRGSYPYGYGDAFGKGGGSILPLRKHSACLIRGESNHLKNSTFDHRSYGHCIFMQAASNPLIEGCLVEGEVRTTDDMLAEEGTGSPADEVNFMTVWGYKLPAGYMLSTGEAGIRAYNAGATVINGIEYERGTSNPTILNCTIKYMRTGVTIAHASGTKYVEGCTAIGCENGYSLGSGDVVNCSADCTYGPVYASTYESDRSFNADITILPASDPYYNGSGSVAYIGGTQHNITFRGSGEAVDMGLKIKIGGDKNNIRLLNGNLPHQNDFNTSNFVIHNLTNYPVFLSDKSANVTGQSGGMVTDIGANNNVVHNAFSVDTIEAEDYDNSSGITTQPTSDINGGENVTAVDATDWFEYQIEVPQTGTYSIDYRIASRITNGGFTLSSNGRTIENVTFSATGADQRWATVRSEVPFQLTKGIQTVRITANNSGWNINKMNLLLECTEVVIVPYFETFNATRELLSVNDTFDVAIFTGNTAVLKPQPEVGGTWSWEGPNGYTSSSRIINLRDIQLTHTGAYHVTFTNDCGYVTTGTFNVSVQDSYLIEAENYSTMRGVITESTTDTGGGDNVTNITTGDWVEYLIEVPFSATYTFDYRVASENIDGDFTVYLDGEEINHLTFPATGGAQTWTTIQSPTVTYLPVGTHRLRLNSNANEWKINWIKLRGIDYVNPCDLPISKRGFVVKNTTIEWSSGLIDISCLSSVNAYIQFAETGTLSDSDYVNVYYKLDGGNRIAISENTGSLSGEAAIVKELSGHTIEVIIQAKATSDTNFYTISRIDILEFTDSFGRLEAEDYNDQNGSPAIRGGDSDIDGGQDLRSIEPGNWIMFENIDLTGAQSVSARFGSIYTDGFVEIRIGAANGTLIGTIDLYNTGSWYNWETVSANIQRVIGIHNVYFVFQTVTSSHVCNVNWFQFQQMSLNVKKIDNHSFKIYPNPVKNDLIIKNAERTKLKLFDGFGRLILNNEIVKNEHIINVSELSKGIYFIKIDAQGIIITKKILKN